MRPRGRPRPVWGRRERWRKRTNPPVLPQSWTGRTTAAILTRLLATLGGSDERRTRRPPSATSCAIGRGWRRCSRSSSPGSGQAYAGRPAASRLVLALPIVLAGCGRHRRRNGWIGGVRNRALRERVPRRRARRQRRRAPRWRGVRDRARRAHAWERIQGHDRRVAMHGRRRRLLVVTVAMHAWVGGRGRPVPRRRSRQVFGPERSTPRGPAGAGRRRRRSERARQRARVRWDGTDRINILLLGTDAVPGARDASSPT